MLRQVLRELQSARGPLTVEELSRRTGIEHDVLEGMLQALVRLGHLRDDAASLSVCDMHCAGCRAIQGCPLPSQPQHTYSVVTRDDHPKGL